MEKMEEKKMKFKETLMSNNQDIRDNIAVLLANIKSQILARQPLILPILSHDNNDDDSMNLDQHHQHHQHHHDHHNHHHNHHKNYNNSNDEKNNNNQSSSSSYIHRLLTFPSPLQVKLPRRNTKHFLTSSNCNNNNNNNNNLKHATHLPSKSNSSRTFVIYVYLLCQIDTLLATNQITTKRDLYYKNVPLFKSQSVVDKAIDVIATSLNVPRLELNVVATPKSCVFGNITIFGKNGQFLDINNVMKKKKKKETL